MRYIGRLLSGEHSDWVQMLRFFLCQQMLKRLHCREVRHWLVEEGLLLLPFSTPQSKTTRNIVQSWFKYRKFLTLDDNALVLPGSLTLKQLCKLLESFKSRRPFNDKILYHLLKRMGISVLANLADGTGKWIEIADAIVSQGTQLSQIQSETVEVSKHGCKCLDDAEEETDNLSTKWLDGTYTLSLERQ
ncbi:hypothetical protein R1flu_022427, partial [Riccia fluitans]